MKVVVLYMKKFDKFYIQLLHTCKHLLQDKSSIPTYMLLKLVYYLSYLMSHITYYTIRAKTFF